MILYIFSLFDPHSFLTFDVPFINKDQRNPKVNEVVVNLFVKTRRNTT